MSASAYAEHLKQALRHGLEINPKLERRQVNGVWGMYATGAIAQGELLARFPKRSLLQPDDMAYGPQVSPSVRMIHTAAREAQKGAASPFAYLFDLHESLEQMQGYSTFFYGEAELAQLRELSPHLVDVIAHENMRWRAVVTALMEFDDALDEDVVITTLLNFSSRGMGSSGFVPVLDCLNHSCAKGSFIDARGDEVKYVARVAYPAGEQVYVFYGWLDLYDHAIFYNYYDSGDEHYLRFGRREFISLQHEQAKQAYRYLSKKYATQLLNMGQHQFFCFKEDDALSGAMGPTPRLQQLLVDYGMRANESRTARGVMADTLRAWLDALERGNCVEQNRRKDLPQSMRRFHDVLSKEKQLVRQARQWLASVS
jgi:hypothetical protein